MLEEKMQAASVDLCTLERCGYLACTGSPFDSAPYFTNIIASAPISVEELDSVEDAPVRYASLRSGREDKHTYFWFYTDGA